MTCQRVCVKLVAGACEVGCRCGVSSWFNIQTLGLACSQLLLEGLVILGLLRCFQVFDLLQLLPSLPFRT